MLLTKPLERLHHNILALAPLELSPTEDAEPITRVSDDGRRRPEPTRHALHKNFERWQGLPLPKEGLAEPRAPDEDLVVPPQSLEIR